MNSFSRTRRGGGLARAASTVALAVLAPAQGCGAGLAECTLDADCDQGRACEVSECVPVCTSDADCSDGESCLQGLTTQRRVCQTADPMSDPSVRSQFAVVRDVTEGAGCEGASPGADLSYVLLESSDGTPVGWAKTVVAMISEGENVYRTYDHLDGDRPDWGVDSCPEFQDSNIVALGCDGFVGVEFLDPNGRPVDLESGAQKLRVAEHGAQCEGGDELDRYEVLLCPAVDDADALPDACSISVGVGQGERAFAF